MNIDNELDKIADGLIYNVDYIAWNAFLADWHINDFDDEKYLRFAQDAAESVRRIQYKASDEEAIKILLSEYVALLKKYDYTDDMIPPAVHSMFQHYLQDWITEIHQKSVNEGGPEEIPELPDGDIDNQRMAYILADLPPQPEVAHYLAEMNINYFYEHLHMVTWFSDQMTQGIRYGFKRKHNFSAKKTYNHLMNPSSLLWIAAALGEDPEIVKKAAAEAKTMKTDPEKCKVVRMAVPFERIYELALHMEEEGMLDDDI